MYLALVCGQTSFPQGFSCPVVLTIPTPSHHPFVYRALTVFGQAFQHCSARVMVAHSVVLLAQGSRGVVQPQHTIGYETTQVCLVWAPPRSLATTRGMPLFSSPY